MLVFYKEIKRHPPNCCLLEVKLDEINIRVMLTCVSMSKIYFNISKWFEFVFFFFFCMCGRFPYAINVLLVFLFDRKHKK